MTLQSIIEWTAVIALTVAWNLYLFYMMYKNKNDDNGST